MGLAISGWVEISWLSDFSFRDREKYSWNGALNLYPLINVTDDISQLIFGYANKKEYMEYKSYFKDRGIPENISELLQVIVKRDHEFEKQYPGEGNFGYSYAYLDEIEKILVEESKLIANSDSDWIAFVGKIKSLFNNYDSRAIRIVVWFSY